MGFFTSVSYYRPCKPPAVTGVELRRFIESLRTKGLLKSEGLLSAQVKFGDSIDQDERESGWQEPVPNCPGVFTMESIDWDIEERRIRTTAETTAVLDGCNERIYRAYVELPPTQELLDPITRRNCPENRPC